MEREQATAGTLFGGLDMKEQCKLAVTGDAAWEPWPTIRASGRCSTGWPRRRECEAIPAAGLGEQFGSAFAADRPVGKGASLYPTANRCDF